MRKDLLLLIPVLMFFSLSSLGRGGTVEYEYLAYSHKTLPIKRLYFLNRDQALGIGERNKEKLTPIYLLDKHNLVQDTFATGEEPLNVIVSNDSTVFLQENSKTVELLVRNNRILLKNQLTVSDNDPNNPVKVLEEPIYIGHHVLGKSYSSVRDFRKKDYCLRMYEVNEEKKVCSEVCPKEILSSSCAKKKNEKDLNYALLGNSLFVFHNKEGKLIRVDLNKEGVAEELDLEEEDWNFYLDHIKGKKYLSKSSVKTPSQYDLFLLDPERGLVFQKSLDQEPFGIVDNRVHYIKKKKDQYFHHLIPLSTEDGFEENNLLEEVQILAR